MENELDFYNTLIDTFKAYIQAKIPLDSAVQLSCRALDPGEAIGNPKRQDFPLLGGREVLIEANFNGFKGHNRLGSFTYPGVGDGVRMTGNKLKFQYSPCPDSVSGSAGSCMP